MSYKIIQCVDKADWLEQRKQVITSTEVSALFGCNPYMTRGQLFAQKFTQIFPERRVTPAMQAGLDEEASIARAVANMKGWEAKAFPNWMFARMKGHLLGSSYDWVVKDQYGLCPDEVKKIHWGAMGRNWQQSGGRVIRVPIHIEFQLQTEMGVCGFDRLKLSVKCGEGWYLWGEWTFNPHMWRLIVDKTDEAWDCIRAAKLPEEAMRTKVWRKYKQKQLAA